MSQRNGVWPLALFAALALVLLLPLRAGPAWSRAAPLSPNAVWLPIVHSSRSVGSRIAFASNRDGDDDIHTMDPDGSSVQNLWLDDLRFADDAAWSPDGTKIAFTSVRDGNDEIYVMDADGSNAARLTRNRYNDQGPVWSPDGSKIAFISDRDGQCEVYVMDADGSNQANRTWSWALEWSPAWSPTRC